MTTGAGQGLATSGGPGSAGSGSGGSPSGSAGSATGSGTGGSTCMAPASGCPPYGVQLPLIDCGAGQIEILANAVDYCAMTPVYCALQAQDILAPGIVASSSGNCGFFHFCVDAGTALNMTIHAPGYLALDFAETQPTNSTQFPANPGAPLLCQAIQGALPTEVSDYNPADPSLIVSIYPQVGAGGAERCYDKSGWQVALSLPDGGAVQASVVYQTGASFNPSAGQTDANGFILFYNIDPSVETVTVHGSLDGGLLEDGGSLCPNTTGVAPLYLTGRVHLEPGKFAYLPYVIPTP